MFILSVTAAEWRSVRPTTSGHVKAKACTAHGIKNVSKLRCQAQRPSCLRLMLISSGIYMISSSVRPHHCPVGSEHGDVPACGRPGGHSHAEVVTNFEYEQVQSRYQCFVFICGITLQREVPSTQTRQRWKRYVWTYLQTFLRLHHQRTIKIYSKFLE